MNIPTTECTTRVQDIIYKLRAINYHDTIFFENFGNSMFINIEPILFDIITNYLWLWITDGLTLLFLAHLIFITQIGLPEYVTTIGRSVVQLEGGGESPKLKKNQLIIARLSPASGDSKLFKDLIKNRRTKIRTQTYQNNLFINFKKIDPRINLLLKNKYCLNQQ